MVIRAEREGETFVRVSISDKGIGIEKEDLSTIWVDFQQIESSLDRHSSGAGLGLAVCHGIVQSHGGRIWVESVLGEGSSFYFTLPTP